MKFTDSHCHLDFTEFYSNLTSILEQCESKKIHRIIVPAVNPEHWDRVLNLTTINEKISIACSLGIHPWFVILQDRSTPQKYDVTLQEIKLKEAVALNKGNIVAIGECGIDVFKAKKNTTSEAAYKKNIQLQQEFFDMQLSLSKENNLPIIVHHCQSHSLILPLLKKHKLNKAGVIHAFSGSYQQAKAYLDLGFKFGIGGTITYPRAKKTINTVKRLPLTSLLLETDAPAMPLSGMQGEINSPLNILAIFQALVNIRSESKENIAAQIENNVEQLFFS